MLAATGDSWKNRSRDLHVPVEHAPECRKMRLTTYWTQNSNCVRHSSGKQCHEEKDPRKRIRFCFPPNFGAKESDCVRNVLMGLLPRDSIFRYLQYKSERDVNSLFCWHFFIKHNEHRTYCRFQTEDRLNSKHKHWITIYILRPIIQRVSNKHDKNLQS